LVFSLLQSFCASELLHEEFKLFDFNDFPLITPLPLEELAASFKSVDQEKDKAQALPAKDEPAILSSSVMNTPKDQSLLQYLSTPVPKPQVHVGMKRRRSSMSQATKPAPKPIKQERYQPMPVIKTEPVYTSSSVSSLETPILIKQEPVQSTSTTPMISYIPLDSFLPSNSLVSTFVQNQKALNLFSGQEFKLIDPSTFQVPNLPLLPCSSLFLNNQDYSQLINETKEMLANETKEMKKASRKTVHVALAQDHPLSQILPMTSRRKIKPIRKSRSCAFSDYELASQDEPAVDVADAEDADFDPDTDDVDGDPEYQR
jgi:hypothetical protein